MNLINKKCSKNNVLLHFFVFKDLYLIYYNLNFCITSLKESETFFSLTTNFDILLSMSETLSILSIISPLFSDVFCDDSAILTTVFPIFL